MVFARVGNDCQRPLAYGKCELFRPFIEPGNDSI